VLWLVVCPSRVRERRLSEEASKRRYYEYENDDLVYLCVMLRFLFGIGVLTFSPAPNTSRLSLSAEWLSCLGVLSMCPNARLLGLTRSPVRLSRSVQPLGSHGHGHAFTEDESFVFASPSRLSFHERFVRSRCFQFGRGRTLLNFFATLLFQSDAYQADLYPPAPASHAALSADEYFNGKTSNPITVNLENQAENAAAPTSSTVSLAPVAAAAATPPSSTTTPTSTAAPVSSAIAESAAPAKQPEPEPEPIAATAKSSAPPPSRQPSTPVDAPSSTPVAATPAAAPSPSSHANGTGELNAAKLESLDRENANLRKQVAERDTLIRKLELQVEQVRFSSSEFSPE
jgi:hypothetical protein